MVAKSDTLVTTMLARSTWNGVPLVDDRFGGQRSFVPHASPVSIFGGTGRMEFEQPRPSQEKVRWAR